MITTPGQKDLGYQQITSLSAAVGFASVPQGTVAVLIQPKTQAIRMRADGTNPTAAVGYPLAAGAEMILTISELADIRFIEQAASATLDCWFFGM